MPISDAYKKIKAWASGVTAQRTDPDDATLMPPLDIAIGWPAVFSADAGETPRRRVFNEIYFRETSALVDIRNHGILPWDAAVDTLQGGTKQVAGVPYRALVDNGPTHGNVTNPTADGQTVWERVAGRVNAPSAPAAAPSAQPGNTALTWVWACPLDGGAVITGFTFQWRRQGAEWEDTNRVAIPAASGARHHLTGLANGQAYEARVFATNARGSSPWSPVGSGTPAATVPGQVQSVVVVGPIV